MQTEVHTSIDNGKATTWCNGYAPMPAIQDRMLPADELYGPDPYDVNFCFPYHAETLYDEKLKLVPFIPRLHAEGFFMHAVSHPEDFQYMRFPVPKTLEEMLAWFEYTYRRNPANMAYAVMYNDGAGNWTFGAFLSLIACNKETLTAECAMGINFREFRGGARATLSASLLLRYCFNTPTERLPGLGLRKVGWTAHSSNYPAQALARSLGFRVESMQRWNRVATHGKKGNGRMLRKDDPLGLPGIDDFYLVMGWDDWEFEGRRLAETALSRKLIPKAKM
ncbi:hypothetical protein SCHPADRAFT_904419 [Schizopora paradoxa]|uniref:N-acetyltransferase domain-containing protein n=1 Tax=Schizopora paradoxa TaxID=27342 RepID=A0A0H2S8N4_9AGAM|nr:hypothetical protein SCHPADRAFT_904419 [Schizopora paradoxa]